MNDVSKIAKFWLATKPIFFDTETTGVDLDSEVIELAVVSHDGEILWNRLYKPMKKIPEFITGITHISEDMVANCFHVSKDSAGIFSLFEGKFAVAYNGNFDQKLLLQSFKMCLKGFNASRLPYATMQDVMKLYAEYRGEPNKWNNGYRWWKLVEATDFMEIEAPKDFHRAVADAEMTRRLLVKLAGGTP